MIKVFAEPTIQERIDDICFSLITRMLAEQIKCLAYEVGDIVRCQREPITDEQLGWIAQLQSYYDQVVETLPSVQPCNFSCEPFTPENHPFKRLGL